MRAFLNGLRVFLVLLITFVIGVISITGIILFLWLGFILLFGFTYMLSGLLSFNFFPILDGVLSIFGGLVIWKLGSMYLKKRLH